MKVFFLIQLQSTNYKLQLLQKYSKQTGLKISGINSDTVNNPLSGIHRAVHTRDE